MEPSKMLKTPHRGIIQTDPITARHDKTWLYIAVWSWNLPLFHRRLHVYGHQDSCLQWYMFQEKMTRSGKSLHLENLFIGIHSGSNCAQIHKKEFSIWEPWNDVMKHTLCQLEMIHISIVFQNHWISWYRSKRAQIYQHARHVNIQREYIRKGGAAIWFWKSLMG